jgi:hypothetical protein
MRSYYGAVFIALTDSGTQKKGEGDMKPSESEPVDENEGLPGGA